jgi:hypothetical protein
VAQPPPPGVPPTDDRSTSEVLASAIASGQALVTKEIELAKLELKQVATDKAIAIGTALGAAVLALFILAFVGVTVAKALELVMAAWLAWLIVTLVYTLLAAGLLFVAYKKGTAPVMERTKTSAEETVAWAKGQVGR